MEEGEDMENEKDLEMVKKKKEFELKPLVRKKKRERRERKEIRADNFLGEGGWGLQTEHLIHTSSLL